MIAEPSSANVTAFPGNRGADARARRLLDMLVARADVGGTWTGTQAELAALLRVNVKTVGRAVDDVRSRGLLTTSGRGTALEYRLQARPATSQRLPTPLRRTSDTSVPNTSDSSGNLRQLTSDSGVRGAAPTSDSQIQASRAGGSLSSSSSSDLGHLTSDSPAPIGPQPQTVPTSDTSDSSTSDTSTSDSPGGGGGGFDGPMVPTARGQLLIEFGVQPDAEMANKWAGLSEAGRAIVRHQARVHPSRFDPPPPSWLHALIDTALELEGRDRLATLVGTGEVSDLPNGRTAEAPDARAGARAEEARRQSPPAGVPPRPLRRLAWPDVLPWVASFVLGAVAVGLVSRGER